MAAIVYEGSFQAAGNASPVNLTIPSGTEKAVIVWACENNPVENLTLASAPTINGTAMTKVNDGVTEADAGTATGFGNRIFAYYLDNPTTGSAVDIAWSYSGSMDANNSQVLGVFLSNTANGQAEKVTTQNVNGTSTSNSITTLTNNSWVVDALSYGSALALTPDNGQVEREEYTASASSRAAMGTYLQATAGAVTLGWSSTESNRMPYLQMAFAPAAGIAQNLSPSAIPSAEAFGTAVLTVVGAAPTITSVGAGEELFNGEHTSVAGDLFRTQQGVVYLYTSSTLVEGSAVQQSVSSWANDLIEFDVGTGSIPDGVAYLFVKNEFNQVSTAFPVDVVTLSAVGNAGISQALMIASVEPLTEYIQDLDTSTISNPAGDFRAPITKTFARIDSVIVSGRNVGGGFSYDIIDKDESLGPRTKIYPGGTLGDATVDITVSGIKAPAATVATPIISPNGGAIQISDPITLSTITTGADIYYTIDGSIPTTSSTLYSAPFTLSADATVKAFAVKSDLADSAVASAAFTVGAVAAPTITPNGGTIADTDPITLATITSGATIYYTIDGSTPTTGSTLYLAPFTLSSDATIKAFAVKSGLSDSAVTSAVFAIGAVAMPTITPNGGAIQDTDPITLATTTSGASIYYTTDGSTPTIGSTLYSGSFTLSTDATVKAFGVKSGLDDSAVASAAFTIGSKVIGLTLSPSPGVAGYRMYYVPSAQGDPTLDDPYVWLPGNPTWQVADYPEINGLTGTYNIGFTTVDDTGNESDISQILQDVSFATTGISVICDDSQACYSETGTGFVDDNLLDSYLGTTRKIASGGGGANYAEYGEIVTATGLASLAVYELHPTNADGATAVSVEIVRDGSVIVSSVSYSQQVNPGMFNLVNFNAFQAGDIDQAGTYKFRITDGSVGGSFVYLDALKFVYEEI